MSFVVVVIEYIGRFLLSRIITEIIFIALAQSSSTVQYGFIFRFSVMLCLSRTCKFY